MSAVLLSSHRLPSRWWSAVFAGILLFTAPAYCLTHSPFHAGGEITTTIAEELSGSATLYHHLQIGERFIPLIFSGSRPAGLEQGAVMADVRGELARDEAGNEWIEVGDVRLLARAAVAEAEPAGSGARRAVLIRVNFQDAQPACSASELAGTMWTNAESVNGLYEANSFGRLSFPPDSNHDGRPEVLEVSVPYTAGGGCDYYNWTVAANQAVAAQGHNLALYQHRVYILPSQARCGWAGMANVGCGANGCNVWITACAHPDVYAHELGHNLGMQHAQTDPTNDGAADCSYCDASCVMGYGGVGWRHFNAVHKAQMEWIPPERRTEVAASGRYALTPVEIDPALAARQPTQILTVPVPGAAGDAYYVSYRSSSQAAYSQQLSSQYRERISIHRRAPNSGYSLLIATLTAGETFEDGKGVAIAVLSAGAEAEVAIGIGGAPATSPFPKPTVEPAPPLLPAAPTAQPGFPNVPNSTPGPPPREPRYRLAGRILPLRVASRSARVVAHNEQSGYHRRARVRAGGVFRMLLPAGRYTLAVEASRRQIWRVIAKRRSVTVPRPIRKQRVAQLRIVAP